MKYIFRYLLSAAFLLITAVVAGQQYFNAVGSQYFRNTYLVNPAFAGAHENAFIYGLHNSSWTGFDGAPKLVQFTVDTRFGAHSGAGVQFLSDKAGVLQRTTLRVSYSYTIETGGEKEFLRLGFSGVGYREQLDNNALTDGGTIDNAVKAFNDRNWNVDADFGVVFQHDRFYASAASSNLRRWLPKIVDDQPIDLPTFHVMTSYKFPLADEYELSPLASARFYTRKQWMLGLGAQFEMKKVFHASLIWQNNSSVVGGLGVLLKDIGELNFMYTTNNKHNAGQQYEVGMGVNIK